MSPYEISQLPFSLEQMLSSLGWTKKEKKIYHERDWDCSWQETHWYKDDQFLIEESDITIGLAYELKKFASI